MTTTAAAEATSTAAVEPDSTHTRKSQRLTELATVVTPKESAVVFVPPPKSHSKRKDASKKQGKAKNPEQNTKRRKTTLDEEEDNDDSEIESDTEVKDPVITRFSPTTPESDAPVITRFSPTTPESDALLLDGYLATKCKGFNEVAISIEAKVMANHKTFAFLPTIGYRAFINTHQGMFLPLCILAFCCPSFQFQVLHSQSMP